MLFALKWIRKYFRSNHIILKLLLVLYATPSFAQSLDQSYQLYANGSVYYLKNDPTWVPIGIDITMFIPVYKDGQVLKLEKVNGNWAAASISFSEFNLAAPSSLNGNQIQYIDANSDGYLDIQIALSGSDGTVNLLNDGTSSVFTAIPHRQVIFIHTDLLGSPAAETNESGNPIN